MQRKQCNLDEIVKIVPKKHRSPGHWVTARIGAYRSSLTTTGLGGRGGCGWWGLRLRLRSLLDDDSVRSEHSTKRWEPAQMLHR